MEETTVSRSCKRYFAYMCNLQMNRKMLHNEVLNQNYVENIIRRLFQICLADQRLISDVSKALKKTDDQDVVNCLFYNHFNDRFFTYVRGVRSRENACEILSI